MTSVTTRPRRNTVFYNSYDYRLKKPAVLSVLSTNANNVLKELQTKATSRLKKPATVSSKDSKNDSTNESQTSKSRTASRLNKTATASSKDSKNDSPNKLQTGETMTASRFKKPVTASPKDPMNNLPNGLQTGETKTTSRLNKSVSKSSLFKHVRNVPYDISKSDLNTSVAKSSRPTRDVPNGVKPTYNSQLCITSFFPKSTITPQEYNGNCERLNVEDIIFGWINIGTDYIPYIVNESEKYCAIRMIENTTLVKYLKTNLIGECNIKIESYPATEVQCRLLNEINEQHCDFRFGRTRFTTNDCIVRLSDAIKYLKFLNIYQNMREIGGIGLEFGFTLINQKSFIPYSILEGVKYVPLFYLHCEGEALDILKSKAYKISGCDALYLRFCCKYDGIASELFENDPIEVINFDEIKSLTPAGTVFKNCWPTEETNNWNEQLRVIQTTNGLRLQHIKRIT